MITFRNSRLADAIRMVRSNPAGVEALDAAEAAEAKARAAEAKALADKRARVDRALDERAAALAADYTARQQEAIIAAARWLARVQLEREFGVTPVRAAALSAPPALLPEDHVSKELERLSQTGSVPWHKGRTAAAVRSEQTRVASEALEASDRDRVLSAADAEARAAERRAELGRQAAAEADRQAGIRARKAAAGLPGWTDAK